MTGRDSHFRIGLTSLPSPARHQAEPGDSLAGPECELDRRQPAQGMAHDGRGLIRWESRKPATNSPKRPGAYPPRSRPDSPEPGKSGASTRKRPASRGSTHFQARALSPPPCRSRSGGPAPPTRKRVRIPSTVTTSSRILMVGSLSPPTRLDPVRAPRSPRRDHRRGPSGNPWADTDRAGATTWIIGAGRREGKGLAARIPRSGRAPSPGSSGSWSAPSRGHTAARWCCSECGVDAQVFGKRTSP